MNQSSTLTRNPSGVQTVCAALSPQESQVLRHISAGFTYGRTARTMGISVNTVDGYLRRIRAKSGVRTQAELVRFAMTLGL
jgi:DNA-binding CsgD family transcriptional regulator